jgi:hypothetical protein
MQQKLERNLAMTFRVTEKERDLIREAMKQSGIKSLRAYLLKQSVNGRIIHIELDSVREMNRLLSNATNNINQIAKRINETDRIHLTDIEEITERQDEIWKQQKEILRRLNKILDTAK